MSSIHFFTPVVYNNQIKTRAQQALETVDEYFYLGNKLRVTIFAPDATHPQAWGLSNRQDRCRSWKNIALKIISYMTLFLPLVALTAKALLRRHLKVSSIQVQSQLKDRLPVYILQNIGSFLSFRDQDQLAQVAHFTQNAARKTQQLTASLKAEVATLPVDRIGRPVDPIGRPVDPIGREDCQRLLVKLVTSPAAGHSKHWASVMNAFMRHVLPLPAGRLINEIIQDHAYVADLLATSEQPISPDQVYQFYKYLCDNQLKIIKPWVVYRALEKYSLKPQLNIASINKALKEFLIHRAETLIVGSEILIVGSEILTGSHNRSYLSNNQTLRIQQTDIDSSEWFGSGKHALWQKISADNISPMPSLLLEVLWHHIQSLRTSRREIPFFVSMIGRMEAELPYNSTLKLAQLITNAGIFLEHDNKIDVNALEKPQYAHVVFNGSAARQLACLEYPNAVEN